MRGASQSLAAFRLSSLRGVFAFGVELGTSDVADTLGSLLACCGLPTMVVCAVAFSCAMDVHAMGIAPLVLWSLRQEAVIRLHLLQF